MPTLEVAAIQIYDGHFELLCLDIPQIVGTRPDRITAMDKPQLEKVIACLLPDTALEDGLKRVLGGAIVVSQDSWLAAKRSFAG
ncbi:hypothetical protein [Terriglobus roseus]|uniref:Uncharacterized protein n=1 Tax=Terriglobus roseus TaxID=392734 RepID=A0A1H4K596_9BACT|nr:hypothetical protein [Terriglobus roseus]SEB53092.1 hypothetical protein SAMN05443244_0986 [Terriglobus roseus]